MSLLYGALLSTLLVTGQAADDPKTPKAHTPQPKRMQECNARVADKKLAGEARKQFMAECLKGPASDTAKAHKTSRTKKPGNGAPSAQGQRMKACSQDAGAKGLRGDERKQFMSQCLKAEKRS